MKKFLILYRSPRTSFEKMTSASPEQMQASMKRWMDWKESRGDFLQYWGLPLGPATLVSSDGGTGKGDENITGSSSVQAESMEQAQEYLKDHPHLTDNEGNSIEIHEMLSMPGVDY